MLNDYQRSGFYNYIFIGLFSLIIISTLIISDLFIYPSLTPFHFYPIGISVLVLLTGIFLLINKRSLYFTWPVIITFLFALYIFIHGKLIVDNYNPIHTYLIFNCCLLISTYCLLHILDFKLSALFKIISIIILSESLICLFQYFGWIDSFNRYFRVTGTWENPNVSAMFLAMASPILWNFIIHKESGFKKLSSVILFLLVASLILLKCRSALFGFVVASFMMLNYKYHITQWLVNKNKRSYKTLLFILCIMALIITGNYLYNAKQTSADGRKIVWKLSLEMISNNPIIGYGYGSFERDYNLFQSKYFQDGKGAPLELKNSDYIKVAYNEFIQNEFEGGILGFLIFSALLFSLFAVPALKTEKPIVNQHVPPKTINNQYGVQLFRVAYAGAIAFAVMSIFNFTILAIPVMCMFVMYAAILAIHPSYKCFYPGSKMNTIKLALITKWATGIGVALIGIYAAFNSISAAYAGSLNKDAAIAAKRGKYDTAIAILKPLGSTLNSYESYWTNYAKILYADKDYPGALKMFRTTISFTSSPDIYMRIGLCYAKLGLYQDAEHSYLIAKYMVPNKIAPRIVLLNLYKKTNDTIKSVKMAAEILFTKPKVVSKKTNYYRNEAIGYIRKVSRSRIGKFPVHHQDSIKRKLTGFTK